MHPQGRGMASGSVKLKINTRSLTMSELVACKALLSKISLDAKFPGDTRDLLI